MSAERRVAAIQVRATDDRDANLAATERLIREAAADGAELILLPELFAVPFVGPDVDLDYYRWAEPVDGPSNEMARRLSAELGVTVVSSVFEAAEPPGVYHNTCFAFVRGTLAQRYRKSHLPFSNGFPEKFYFRAGDEPPGSFDVDEELRVGTIICYERHFPELGRLVGLTGAQVMCVPVACASEPTREVFTLELRAHAAFNSLYVVCANRVGTEHGKTYYGASAVYGPDGSVLAMSDGDGEQVVAASVDIEAARRRRHVLPFYRDRRPDLYGGLTTT